MKRNVRIVMILCPVVRFILHVLKNLIGNVLCQAVIRHGVEVMPYPKGKVKK